MGDGGGLRRVAGGLKEDTGGKHLMAIEVSMTKGGREVAGLDRDSDETAVIDRDPRGSV